MHISVEIVQKMNETILEALMDSSTGLKKAGASKLYLVIIYFSPSSAYACMLHFLVFSPFLAFRRSFEVKSPMRITLSLKGARPISASKASYVSTCAGLVRPLRGT